MKTWTLTESDIERIAIGTGILGTGGGGNSYLAKLMAREKLRQGHEIKIIQPDDLPDDAIVLAVGAIGAPTVGLEKIEEGFEGDRIIDAMEQATGLKIAALIADEIGGGNGLSPMNPAAVRGLPIVDADGMGRAFPETQMTSFFVGGQATTPAALTDTHGNAMVVTAVQDAVQLERMMRSMTITMGCSAFMATAPMTGAFIKKHSIRHTVSFAWELGNAVLNAQDDKTDPVDAVLATSGGRPLIRGKIIDIERTLSGGFARGLLNVAGLGDDTGRNVKIDIQNEFIFARENDEPLVMVPDLICIVDSKTGKPIQTEELRYGLRISVLCLPAPRYLRSDAALDVMGPRAFGYDCEFVPMDEPYDPAPVKFYKNTAKSITEET
ncbi:DUF917 domain-containing protein [uncultured Ruegeria sp.]|uniref:DUF917 domain-containing protein n=1 Tax=uncultured Ruegeria sp. TaxID=259304 RepID=UPI002605E04F|nr:DUF917 domain-containing protein [uncultured Ruegeria sp.]